MKKIQTKLTKSARKEAEEVLRGILEICQIYHAPMFASVVVENSDNKTLYDNMVYSAQSHQCRLYNDSIRDHILIANGFETLPPCDEDEAGRKEKTDSDNVKGRRYTDYMLSEEQKKEIADRMSRLEKFSEKYGTSVFASAAVSNHDGNTEYMHCYKRPDSQSYLNHDEMKKHMSVVQLGFHAVPPREAPFLDMEEVFGEYVETE